MCERVILDRDDGLESVVIPDFAGVTVCERPPTAQDEVCRQVFSCSETFNVLGDMIEVLDQELPYDNLLDQHRSGVLERTEQCPVLTVASPNPNPNPNPSPNPNPKPEPEPEPEPET